jgi:hypothetical protein
VGSDSGNDAGRAPATGVSKVRAGACCPFPLESAQEGVEVAGSQTFLIPSPGERTMKTIRLPFAALALAGAVALAGCEATPTEAPGAPDGLHGDHSGHVASSSRAADAPAHGASDLARMRAGSAPYRNFAHAEADGFIPLSPCVESPMGGMGYHYGSPQRLGTISVDPARPEILLYAPDRNGRMELVGVEFFVNADAWYAAGNTAPPSVAGVEYDPPNPQHPDPMVAAAYTLHVWLWADNPSGLFAPFNPNVSCG